jgi:hypothetical protein
MESEKLNIWREHSIKNKYLYKSCKVWVMLHIILLSSFYHPKIDVALKITIGSKFNNDLS